jgi:hypothetical protein
MFVGRPLADLVTGEIIHLGYDVLPTLTKRFCCARRHRIFPAWLLRNLGAAWSRRLPWPSSFHPRHAARAGWLFFILGTLLFSVFW